jgi:hypothetical protein
VYHEVHLMLQPEYMAQALDDSLRGARREHIIFNAGTRKLVRTGADPLSTRQSIHPRKPWSPASSGLPMVLLDVACVCQERNSDDDVGFVPFEARLMEQFAAHHVCWPAGNRGTVFVSKLPGTWSPRGPHVPASDPIC